MEHCEGSCLKRANTFGAALFGDGSGSCWERGTLRIVPWIQAPEYRLGQPFIITEQQKEGYLGNISTEENGEITLKSHDTHGTTQPQRMSQFNI